jgi:hypothetical protein
MAGPTDPSPDEVLLGRIQAWKGKGELLCPTWGEVYIAEALLIIHQDLANLVWELRALKEGWPNGSY